jgi:hypothetical protein
MSSHTRLIRRVGACVAGAPMVVVGATVTTIARAGSNDEATSAPVLAQLHPSRVLPRNAHGLSYGSSEQATSDAEVPNLVLVYATNGKLGYVNSSDLIGKSPANPQQAIASNSANSRAAAIPVYAVDGVTKIGEFVKQPATPR